MKKNVASQVVGAQLVSASDGSAFTGSVTCSVTGDGGTQATGSVGSGACTHEGNGFHTYAPAQAETNYDHVAFTFTGTGAVPVTVQVYPTFPQTGDSYARIGAAGASLSAIPWNASWDAEVQSECTDALNAYDPPTSAELVAEIDAVQTDIAALNDLDAAGIRSAVGLASNNLDTQLSTIDTVVDSILADTGTDGVVVAAGSKSGYSLAADQSAVTVGTVTDVTNGVTLAADAIDALAIEDTASILADVRKINNVTLTGTGTLGDEFGPA